MMIKYVKAKMLGLIKKGEVKKCPHCGNLALAKAKLCPKCGESLDENHTGN